MEGGINKEFGINTSTLHIKQITDKDLLCSAGNAAQYLAIIYKRKESGKKQVYACMTQSLCCTPETNATLLVSKSTVL